MATTAVARARGGPLEGVILGGLAAVGPLAAWGMAALAGSSGAPVFNDFNSYWLAGRLVAAGQSPYDLAALVAEAERTGRAFVLGTGYSYPPPFAVAMIPLGRLPFDVAVALFLGASVVAFAAAVAAWLRWLPIPEGGRAAGARRFPIRWRRLAALGAGCFPPVLGSVAAGQANLLVTAVLAAGVAAMVRHPPGGRPFPGGALAGLAAVVKVVPAVLVVPLVLGGRWRDAAALALAVAGALLAASLLAPWATGGGESLLALLEPDPYFTNVSINGFVSRLVRSTDMFPAVLPGAFDPALVACVLTAALALATLAVLWAARRRLRTTGGLATGLALALLAAIAGAPKDSLWNATPALLAGALLLVPRGPEGGEPIPDRALVAAFIAGPLVQVAAWAAAPSAPAGPPAAVLNLAGSAALLGLLALWWYAARRLGVGGRSA